MLPSIRLRDFVLPFCSHLCQAEIQNLGVTPFRDEYICRLDVTVDNTLRMRCVKGVSNLDSE